MALAATLDAGLAAGLATFAGALTEAPALAADWVAGAAFAGGALATLADDDDFVAARLAAGVGFDALDAGLTDRDAAFAGAFEAARAELERPPPAAPAFARAEADSVFLGVATGRLVVVMALLTTGPRWVDRENLLLYQVPSGVVRALRSA
jgi:hypothetical protein